MGGETVLAARAERSDGVSRDGMETIDPRAERWVLDEVEDAHIHCSKHVPLLARRDKTIAWGTDDARLKGGDYFEVSASRRTRPAAADR